MSVFGAIEEQLDAEIFSLRRSRNEAVENIKIAMTALYCTPRFTKMNKDIIETALRMALENLAETGRGGSFPESPHSDQEDLRGKLPRGF